MHQWVPAYVNKDPQSDSQTYHYQNFSARTVTDIDSACQ